MRFMRLPFLMVVIALAASVSPQFGFLLRFSAMALATLTLLGALSDMQRVTRHVTGMPRDDLIALWFGGKRREGHTWEALNAQVSAMASALLLAPHRPTLPLPDPITNGNRTSGPARLSGKALQRQRARSRADEAQVAERQPAPEEARPSLVAFLRLLAIEGLSEAVVIAAIALNWFRPAPGTPEGEQLGLLVLGLLALGLLWFDWRLVRRFVGAVQAELTRLAPQASTRATSSS